MRTNALIAATLSAMLLAGCGGGDAADAPASSVAPKATDASVQQTPTTEASPEESADDKPESTVKPAAKTEAETVFGGDYAYKDGFGVLVSEPKEFSPEGAKSGATKHVVFDITVTNKSDKPWDPAGLKAELFSAGVHAEPLTGATNVKVAPTSPVAPGDKAQFQIAFGVLDTYALEMDLQPEASKLPVRYLQGAEG